MPEKNRKRIVARLSKREYSLYLNSRAETLFLEVEVRILDPEGRFLIHEMVYGIVPNPTGERASTVDGTS